MRSQNGVIGNNFLNRYNNFQKENVPFQNNNLLSTNPRFQNSMNNNGSLQMQQIMRMKQMQQIKKEEMMKNLGNIMEDKEKIRESVIRPYKENKQSSEIIIAQAKLLESDFTPKLQEWWLGRTNQPYKNILKNLKEEDYKKKYERKEDLVIHRVSSEDKIGLLNDYEEMKKNVEDHNKELKKIYAPSKEMEYKKNFKYIYKYKDRVKHNPKDFNDMKNDQIEFHKKEQQRMERNRNNIDDTIESCIASGIFDTEKNNKGKRKKDKRIRVNEDVNKNICDKTSSEDDIDNELKAELGDDYDDIMRQVEKELKNERKSLQMEKASQMQTQKKIKIRRIERENRSEINESKNISAEVDSTLRDKYKNRQKK